MNPIQFIKSLIKVARLMSSSDEGSFQTGVFFYQGSEKAGQIFVPYGLLSRPPNDAQILSFAQNGQQSNQIGLASDPKTRVVTGLEPGESGVANHVSKSYLLLKNDGSAELIVVDDLTITATGDITINAPSTTFTGDVFTEQILENQGIVFADHVHPQGPDGGGNSEQDTGVPQ